MQVADSAPVYTAAMAPRTVGKVDRRLFYLNAGLGVFLLSAMHNPWLLIVPLVMHLFTMWATVRQPDLIMVYARYRRQGDYYRSWISPRPWIRNRRPDGFDRH